jgi:hypothetical protein
MEGKTLRLIVLEFRVQNYLLNTKSLNKSYQFRSMVKFVELDKIVILPYFPYNPKGEVKIRGFEQEISS